MTSWYATFRRLGDLQTAIAFLQRAVRIHEVAYCPEHPATDRVRAQLETYVALG